MSSYGPKIAFQGSASERWTFTRSFLSRLAAKHTRKPQEQVKGHRMTRKTSRNSPESIGKDPEKPSDSSRINTLQLFTTRSMPELLEEDILGLWRLRGLLHELKSQLFEALSSGERCVLRLVLASREVCAIDAAASSIVRACHEHLKICKLEREARGLEIDGHRPKSTGHRPKSAWNRLEPTRNRSVRAEEGLKDLPIFLSPVMPMSASQFEASELCHFLSLQGLGRADASSPLGPRGYDVLLFEDSVALLLQLAQQSQRDPCFPARIDLVEVTGPPLTTASATPTAGSCGLHVAWAAFQLLEMLSLLVPSRCGPALFLKAIDGTGGEDVAMRQALKLAQKAMVQLTEELLPSLEDRVWNRTAPWRMQRPSTVFWNLNELNVYIRNPWKSGLNPVRTMISHDKHLINPKWIMCKCHVSKDSDLVFAIGAILKGMPTVRQP